MESVERVSRAGPSDSTLRAIERVRNGEGKVSAAVAEGISPSTLFRALAKTKPEKRYVVIDKHPDRFDAWIENQRFKQLTPDVTYATLKDLQAGLPELLAQC